MITLLKGHIAHILTLHIKSQRLGSALASAQSDPRLHYPHEESLKTLSYPLSMQQRP